MIASAKKIVQFTPEQRDSRITPESFLRIELSLGAVPSDVET
jgi:hypothetical protein